MTQKPASPREETTTHFATRRDFLSMMGAGALATALPRWVRSEETGPEKPNIVIMFLDNISGNCDYTTYIYNGRNDLYRNTQPAKATGYSTYVFADEACTFIERNKDRPFFCYVPFNAAHYRNPKNKPPGTPCLWQAPDEAFERYGYRPDTLDERRRYRAVVTALDDGVGRVLDQLDRLKLTEKTIVIVLSDNGAFMIPQRGLECASNLPLRAGGTTLWEGGIRVPCVVRWPGRIKPGTLCREPLVSMDIVPMALRAAALAPPTDRVLDGRDPTETLAGRAPSPHTYLYWTCGTRSAAIRMGRYKLIRERYSTSQDWQLFDLQTDIGESANLMAAKPVRPVSDAAASRRPLAAMRGRCRSS